MAPWNLLATTSAPNPACESATKVYTIDHNINTTAVKKIGSNKDQEYKEKLLNWSLTNKASEIKYK